MRLWRVLLAVFLAAAAFSMIRPVLAYRARYDLMATGFEVSMLATGFMVARALSSPAAGYAGDRVRGFRGRMVKGALASFPLLTLGYAWAPSPWILVALRSAAGFTAGIAWPGMQTIVAENAPGERRATYLGLYFATGNLGFSLGYGLYGHLPLTRVEYFYLAAAMQTATIFLLLPESFAEPLLRGVGWGGGLPALWLMLASFAGGFTLGTSTEVTYVYLRELHGVGKALLGDALLVGSLLGAASTLLSGRLADRLGEYRAISLILLSTTLGLVLLPLNHRLAALAGMVLIMAAGRALLPATRSMATVLIPGLAGTLVGLSNTLSNLGSAASPSIAGIIYDNLSGTLSLGPLQLLLKASYTLPAVALNLAVILLGPLMVKRAGSRGFSAAGHR